jgi:hypothetical protein
VSPSEFKRHVEGFSDRAAWELSEREPPMVDAEIREYERAHRCCFPAEYRFAASAYGCGFYAFVELLSVRPGPWSIDEQRRISPGLPEDFVPISGNGCGDFYGFAVVDGHCESWISFADHEEGYALRATEFQDLYEYLCRHGLHAV